MIRGRGQGQGRILIDIHESVGSKPGPFQRAS
ncbi:hypothetical protein BCO71171_03775 [Burkholderia contaminans]|uniref:Uncharacterized protein n=1 Tax=Burkholderia contaminans TaxID=488447 RepID=A0A6P2Z2X1_9BURK|nr:hypothetical protein BCO71171_03775 [Burkholderia contaminans]